jgi:hypothetical protein
MKGLFKAEEEGSYNARYGQATLPGMVPRLFAMNPGVVMHAGIAMQDHSDLFSRQGLDVLATMMNRGNMIGYGEGELAIARNAILFKCPDRLVEAPPDGELHLHNPIVQDIHQTMLTRAFTL